MSPTVPLVLNATVVIVPHHVSELSVSRVLPMRDTAGIGHQVKVEPTVEQVFVVVGQYEGRVMILWHHSSRGNATPFFLEY
jgi:hypothetical protein